MPSSQSIPPLSGKLRQILDRVQRLRPLPSTATRVLKSLEDPNSTAGIVADFLGLDQALTAQVLQAANSAFLGYSTPCSSVSYAVSRLGFKRVRALVLNTVAAGPLNRRLNGYRLGADALWQHSLATAVYSDKIARAVYYPEPEDAYVAGLLHDIGKLLLDQFVLTDYQYIVSTMKQRDMRLWEVEEELFGIDHAGVGGMMATKWNLPASLVQALRYHHIPVLSRTHRKLTAIVNIANTFAPKDDMSLAGLDGRLMHPISLEILNLDNVKLDRLWQLISSDTQSLNQYS